MPRSSGSQASKGPLLGAHTSVAGGLPNAVARGIALRCNAIQIFTRNKTRWQSPALPSEEAEAFKSAFAASSISRVVAHGSYLVNLASPDPLLRRKSLDALVDEIARASALAIPYVIFHPGAAVGCTEREGLRNMARSLDELVRRVKHLDARPAIETTAGQGSSLGCRFEHLEFLWNEARSPEELFLCVDTCHVFAAGYDIRTEAGYGETFRTLERAVPLSRLVCFHLNDSKRELGSRVDRHEHIGKGAIGRPGFRFLLNDPRFAGIPMVLETPKGPDLKEDRLNLRVLRSLLPR